MSTQLARATPKAPQLLPPCTPAFTQSPACALASFSLCTPFRATWSSMRCFISAIESLVIRPATIVPQTLVIEESGISAEILLLSKECQDDVSVLVGDTWSGDDSPKHVSS
mmetsp:Transcript_32372/g.86817  ORF Transcript_32372/g.86817 Transcript_32372/m.86817 type:complete len:111 (+) Transcript_32372:1823-2155(+)